MSPFIDVLFSMKSGDLFTLAQGLSSLVRATEAYKGDADEHN